MLRKKSSSLPVFWDKTLAVAAFQSFGRPSVLYESLEGIHNENAKLSAQVFNTL